MDFLHLGLELNEAGVVVVVSLNLGLQPPVAILPDFVDNVGVRGRVGSDGLEEPGRNDVGGGFAGNGWLSVKLMEVDVIIGASESPLDEAGTW